MSFLTSPVVQALELGRIKLLQLPGQRGVGYLRYRGAIWFGGQAPWLKRCIEPRGVRGELLEGVGLRRRDDRGPFGDRHLFPGAGVLHAIRRLRHGYSELQLQLPRGGDFPRLLWATGLGGAIGLGAAGVKALLSDSQ